MSLWKKRMLVVGCLSILLCIGIWTKAQEITTQEVVSWMYENGLTIYSNQQAFKPANKIRRDEAAKLITLFAKNVLFQEWDRDSSCYGFTDVSSQNTMKAYITQVCELWYMKWSNKKFNPTWNLTNQQAIAIIIRMFEWWMDEPKYDRSRNYYTRAKELGLLEWTNLQQKTVQISRWVFATLLYKLSILNDETTILSWWDILWSGLEMLGDAMLGLFWLKINSYTGLSQTFIDQAATCISGANSTTEIEFEMIGINFYTKSYREIRWWEGGKCKVYERTEDFRADVSTWMLQSLIESGTTQAEIDERMDKMQESTQESIGKDGICKYSTWELVSMLALELSWQLLSSMTSSNDGKDCTWSLYD